MPSTPCDLRPDDNEPDWDDQIRDSLAEERQRAAFTLGDFVECDACAGKPGMPSLCGPCLANRTTIHRLQATIREQVKRLPRSVPHGDGAIVVAIARLPAVITTSIRDVLASHGYQIGSHDIDPGMRDVLERTDHAEQARTLDELGRNAAQCIVSAASDLGDEDEIRARVGAALDHRPSSGLHADRITAVIKAVIEP